jgi:hypothetical protein
MTLLTKAQCLSMRRRLAATDDPGTLGAGSRASNPKAIGLLLA